MPAKPNLPSFRHGSLQAVMENGFKSFLVDDYQSLSISLVKFSVDPRTFTWVGPPFKCTTLLRLVKGNFLCFKLLSLERIIKNVLDRFCHDIGSPDLLV